MTNILLLLFGLLLQQTDWPQWGGVDRNFQIDISIKDLDPAQPLTEMWKTKVGEGYSGVVVDSGLVISQDRYGDVESVFALDLATGDEVWRTDYDAPALEMMIPRYGFGPHSTPCIADGIICSVGGTGIVRGTELTSGKTKWTCQLWEKLGVTKLERGYSASPIYSDGKFIVPVGGEGMGIVAFDAKTGNEVWQSTDCESAYSSPEVATLAGQRQLICLMENALVSLNPANGETLWIHDYKPTNTVHVASPITLSGDRVLVLSSNRATMLRVYKNERNAFSIEEVWKSRRMTFQIGNVIQIDNRLLGPSSTSSSAVLTSININDGQLLWRNRVTGTGFLYKAKDGFISISDRGRIAFNELDGEDLKTLSTAKQKLNGRIWNTAAFSNGLMLIRDSDHVFALKFQARNE